MMSHRVFIFVLATVAFGCTPKQPSRNNPKAESASSTSAVRAQAPHATHANKDKGSENLETAYLAGGCFWGMQEILRKIPGVVHTEVGYAGGKVSSPRYEDVRNGRSGHAETVLVRFDPKKLSYSNLLEKWFFRMHDPTTKNSQGNDIGSQYRSAIFVTSAQQRTTAEAVIKRVTASGKWSKPIATMVSEAGPFTRAESYHQDYLQNNPGGYTCHYLRDWES